jgi:hypothetical protein
MRKSLISVIGFLLFTLSALSQPVSMSIEDDGFWIKEGNNKIFYYQRNSKSQDGAYKRSHYFHPLVGLDGEILTEDFPLDHPHHRGVFWAWHQLWYNDTKIGDPWLTKNFQQDVNRVDFYQGKNGTGVLEAKVEWKSPLVSDCGVPQTLVNERTKVTVHRVEGDYRRIDFHIELQAAVKGIRIGGSEDVKGYSGFSVRMRLVDGMEFRDNRDFVEPQNTAIEADSYVDISGPIGTGGNKAGICIVDHPDNPPHKWILRKKRSMQNCAYPGRDCIDIPTDRAVVLQYTLLVHRGDIKDLDVKEILKDIFIEL